MNLHRNLTPGKRFPLKLTKNDDKAGVRNATAAHAPGIGSCAAVDVLMSR
ncbi:Uncharacterised protein [Mycobacteroides abscessus subsp. abscessus]|nr:Uncharacterised protein [Mycobacteroides abscessus subsp. abscessus]